MIFILKDAEYTLSAADSTITLVAPYDGLDVGQIVSIINVTKDDLIYSSERRVHSISIAGAVITHTYDNSNHADTDKLQISIDVVPAVTSSVTGTTANAYTNGLEWAATGIKNKGVFLKNTDAANSLKYKVLTYRHPTGQAKEFVAETTLAATKTVDIVLNDAYALIDVAVKSALTDTHATYQIDNVGDE